jgi:hypothetical protein
LTKVINAIVATVMEAMEKLTMVLAIWLAQAIQMNVAGIVMLIVSINFMVKK